MLSIRDKGVGASLIRKEDRRYLRGQGRFIADIALAGMVDQADPLGRSTVASEFLLDVSIVPVPQPGTLAIGAMVGLGVTRRRR